MPSYAQLLETIERWRRYPGRERTERGVALTFDDGPDPDATPAVLDALDAAEARATFFLVGEQVMRHRALAREIATRGHGIGLHGFEHVEHEEMGGRVKDDLARALGVIEVACGRRPTLFRPPYGRCSEISYVAAGQLGLDTVYWNAWGMDWEPVGADRIADLATRDLADGQIVLLHDSARYAYRDSAAATAEAVPAIAEAVRAAGLDPVTLAPR